MKISSPNLTPILSVLCLPYSEHLCATGGAYTLSSRLPILHGDRLGVFHLLLGAAFHTIRLHKFTSTFRFTMYDRPFVTTCQYALPVEPYGGLYPVTGFIVTNGITIPSTMPAQGAVLENKVRSSKIGRAVVYFLGGGPLLCWCLLLVQPVKIKATLLRMPSTWP